MHRHVLSILVDNHSGVLTRLSGLFARRGYNIESLSVGVTDDPKYSRITVVAFGDDAIIDQIHKQLSKQVNVLEVSELAPDASVFRELALIKIMANPGTRTELTGLVDIFRANIVDVSYSSITVEITGDQNKLSAFIELARPYGVTEIVRTGLTGIQRGCGTITGA